MTAIEVDSTIINHQLIVSKVDMLGVDGVEWVIPIPQYRP